MTYLEELFGLAGKTAVVGRLSDARWCPRGHAIGTARMHPPAPRGAVDPPNMIAQAHARLFGVR
jgi:hypothetical protein